MDSCYQQQRLFIGDDWVFVEVLLDESDDPLDLDGCTVGATYFAPAGTTPAEVDVSASVSITPGAKGTVRVVVSKDITGQIPSLPAGRKRPPAHIQIFVIKDGLRTTRRVLIVDPEDAKTLPTHRGDADPGVYRRLRGFGYPTLIF